MSLTDILLQCLLIVVVSSTRVHKINNLQGLWSATLQLTRIPALPDHNGGLLLNRIKSNH